MPHTHPVLLLLALCGAVSGEEEPWDISTQMRHPEVTYIWNPSISQAHLYSPTILGSLSGASECHTCPT